MGFRDIDMLLLSSRRFRYTPEDLAEQIARRMACVDKKKIQIGAQETEEDIDNSFCEQLRQMVAS